MLSLFDAAVIPLVFDVYYIDRNVFDQMNPFAKYRFPLKIVLAKHVYTDAILGLKEQVVFFHSEQNGLSLDEAIK